MENRPVMLKEIHRDLVSLAVSEQFSPRRRKTLENAIGSVAELIAAEKPMRTKRGGYVGGLSLTSAILGIVAALISLCAYWLA